MTISPNVQSSRVLAMKGSIVIIVYKHLTMRGGNIGNMMLS